MREEKHESEKAIVTLRNWNPDFIIDTVFMMGEAGRYEDYAAAIPFIIRVKPNEKIPCAHFRCWLPAGGKMELNYNGMRGIEVEVRAKGNNLI